MSYQAIAWDVDGTLVDSEPLHHRALVAVCSGYGIDLSHIPESRFCGVHINDVWLQLRSLLPATAIRERWLAEIETWYIAHSAELAPIDGSVETLRQLQINGVRQACVSNSSQRIVEANLRALGVFDTMAFIISLDDVERGKPDAEPYLKAQSRFGLAAHQVLAVEDSVTGVLAARAAGLDVAGYSQESLLHPQCLPINHLSQLIELVTLS